MTSTGIGLYGRVCRDPFRCTGSRDESRSFGCKCAAPGNVKSDCFECDFEAGEYGQKCLKCKKGKFLNRGLGICQDDCSNVPASISYAVGKYGRECRAPFVCDHRTDPNGNECKCSNAIGKHDCVICSWDQKIGGGTENICVRCGSNLYLKNGKCVENCGDLIPVGNGVEGRECQ